MVLIERIYWGDRFLIFTHIPQKASEGAQHIFAMKFSMNGIQLAPTTAPEFPKNGSAIQASKQSTGQAIGRKSAIFFTITVLNNEDTGCDFCHRTLRDSRRYHRVRFLLVCQV